MRITGIIVKEELNDYKITNADGTSKVKYVNEGRQSFDNDKRTFVRESFSVDEGEAMRFSESFEGEEQGGSSSNAEISAAESTSLSSVSTTTSTVATAASSVGSGIGALAGAIASAVATAAIVVAVFVSTLVIDISLAMADMHSLVFDITMQGVQSEDFEDPINAVLTSDDGTYLVQPVTEDTKILTFDDLQSGREYLITIRNSEKIFVEKSYFTATTALAKGNIAAGFVDGEVMISVSNVTLQKGEFYTLYAKDASEKTLFAKDGVEANAEYRFSLAEQKDLYFSLSVNGKTLCMAQLLFEKEETNSPSTTPYYDFEHPSWSWSEDHLSATVSFTDLVGGSPLVLEASIDEQKIYPDCENQGKITYTATANYEDRSFRDEAVVVLQAYGHALYWNDGCAASCETEGMLPHNVCAKCGKCFDEDEQEVSESSLTEAALGHDYGSLNEEVPASCMHEGHKAYYQCSVCEKYFDEGKSESNWADLCLSPTGHSLSFYPDGETIYVRCDNYCSETFPSLTIEAPTLTVEGGGGSRYATLSGLNEFNLATDSSVSEDDIIYYSASAAGILEEAPTTAGVYYASITVYSAVIAVQYEIASN